MVGHRILYLMGDMLLYRGSKCLLIIIHGRSWRIPHQLMENRPDHAGAVAAPPQQLQRFFVRLSVVKEQNKKETVRR